MFSSALTLHSLLSALSCPVVGWLVDRWGARRVMIPGLLVYAAATASYALIQASPFALTYLLFAARRRGRRHRHADPVCGGADAMVDRSGALPSASASPGSGSASQSCHNSRRR